MKETLPLDELKEVAPEPINLESVQECPSPHVRDSSSPFLKSSLRGLSKVQRYSSYGFAGFLGIHVASVVIIPGLKTSLPLSQEVFEMSRSLYQGIPYYETLAIIGSSIVHVGAGMLMRLIRWYMRRKNDVSASLKRNYENKPIIMNDLRDDIGLGGATGLLGLGYKKSWISTQLPTLSPLSFSGYVLIPLYIYHFLKFRYYPVLVDGDSSLITMDYITYYLNFSPLGFLGRTINICALGIMVWVASYHSVSGMSKLLNKRSMKHKKIAYGIVNGVSLLGLISIWRFKRNPMKDLDSFFGKSFLKYLSISFI